MQTNINSGFSHPQLSISSFRNGSMIDKTQFLKFLTVSRGLSNKSIKTYMIKFVIVDKWHKDNNKLITRRTVEDFIFELKEKGYSNSGINSYIQSLQHLAACYKSYELDGGFMEGIKSLPKKRFSGIPLSLEEARKISFTHLEYKNRNGVNCIDLDFKYLSLTRFLLFSGCRPDEGYSLTVGQIDIDSGRAMLTDTKNKETRFIFFDGPIKDDLRIITKNKNPDDLVFTNSKGAKMHSGDFGNDLKKRALKAGITKHVNPHLLRHTYATLYYNYTHDIAMVAKLLGHKDIGVTFETYVFFDTEGIQRGAGRHPLLSPYIPISQALLSFKEAIDALRIKDDNRLVYEVFISDNELNIRIKSKEAQNNLSPSANF